MFASNLTSQRQRPKTSTTFNQELKFASNKTRCSWCLGSKNPDVLNLYVQYHDEEWGGETHSSERHHHLTKFCLQFLFTTTERCSKCSRLKV